jgi:hypothetical protein
MMHLKNSHKPQGLKRSRKARKTSSIKAGATIFDACSLIFAVRQATFQ